jgi:hypothetical protein
MATRLQRLLGLAPLQNLMDRSKQNDNPLNQGDLNVQSPIQQMQVQQPMGYTPMAAGVSTPRPVAAAPVRPNYFNQQMQNTGMQTPFDPVFIDEAGPEDEIKGGASFATPKNIQQIRQDIEGIDYFLPGVQYRADTDDGDGEDIIDVPEGADETTTTSQRWKTDPQQLLASFFSALPPGQSDKLTRFTSLESEEGVNLSNRELAAIAGYDYDRLQGSQLLNLLGTAGIGEFKDQFADAGQKLGNLQEMRSQLFADELEDASSAYQTLMSYVEQGSTSGLISGEQQVATERATKDLESVLSRQLAGAESQYLGEVDALLSSRMQELTDSLGRIRADVEAQNIGEGVTLDDLYGGSTGTYDSGLMGVTGFGGVNFGNFFRHRQDTGSWGDFDFSSIMGGYNNG